MFLTISTTGGAAGPATDLGYLLHKHPDRAQEFATSYGTAHVFYPEASDEVCTAALLLEVDPVALVWRGRGKGRGGAPDSALAQYVNDRPYAASSLLATALSGVFSSAMKGVCRSRPERAAAVMPLRIVVPAVPARGGAELTRALFEPLGWTVAAEPVALDEQFPEWGESRYVSLTLEGETRLSDALRQLYVLLPVLDDAKHYWSAPDEVDKLLRAGEGWLATHPERRLITARYLSRRWSLARQAVERLELARLAESDDTEADDLDNAVEADDLDSAVQEIAPDEATPDPSTPDARTEDTDPVDADLTGARAEDADPVDASLIDASLIDASLIDADPVGPDLAGLDPTGPKPTGPGGAHPAGRTPLAVHRQRAVLDVLRDSGAARVLDLGCGEGRLVRELLKDARYAEVVGMDVSVRALAIAARRLGVERMPERQSGRLKLLHGSLTYTDRRLKGYDAAVLSEVVEHLDAPRLPALEYAVFGAARPGTVVVTTPNAEYNVRWETLPAGHVRHHDHRFEWDRREFRDWAWRIAGRYGYTVTFAPVGDDDPEVGPPTQMAVFHLTDPTPDPPPAPGP
ncbi:3' terminal RNA ribose 2'-O-methyltransferase Hen1, partial [Streptantibioticus silvisoli]